MCFAFCKETQININIKRVKSRARHYTVKAYLAYAHSRPRTDDKNDVVAYKKVGRRTLIFSAAAVVTAAATYCQLIHRKFSIKH